MSLDISIDGNFAYQVTYQGVESGQRSDDLKGEKDCNSVLLPGW